VDRLVINHAFAVVRETILEDFSVICENGLITELLPSKSVTARIEGQSIEGLSIDAKGQYLVPGFIDMHIHGFNGKLVKHSAGDLAAVCRELPQRGVTAFLPTLTPGVFDTQYNDEYELLSDLACAQTNGAQIAGFFLEGHFLKLTGAIKGMEPDYSAARVLALKKSLKGRKCVFGISPEIEGITGLLPLMCGDGVPAFITHTCANYDQTAKAIEAGARHATHFYDVFPYPGEQEDGVRGCGVVEAVMAGETTVDFILDGEHVHPGAVKMALACKGPDNVCLVTDANINAGMKPGVYRGIGGMDVIMEYPGGPAREFLGIGKKPGGLTGSGLTMDLALKNAVKLLNLSLPQASAMVSANPARVLGLNNERGRIEKGYRADFCLLDKNLNVTACYIEGKCAYPV